PLLQQREEASVLKKIHQAIADVQEGVSEPGTAGTARAIPEDVARGAFALVQKLDLETLSSPPTLLTVFRMYCIEVLSAELIAKKCQCSKSTVLRRLRFIGTKTGMHPDQFRMVSG